MQIRMLRTAKGSPDGLRTFAYAEGQEYTVPDDLAAVFLHDGAAAPVIAEPEPAPEPEVIEADEPEADEPAVEPAPKARRRPGPSETKPKARRAK